ncbi:hypothetical protein RI129_004315 [Pyrocoelia pectoralis]|uniref:Uncharacterized protein n=1 Tax=Pyrocoelia pectoralis TaxID=417401 RepID=A0AAN7VI20_9COLE
MKLFVVLCSVIFVQSQKLSHEVIVNWEDLHFPHFDRCVNESQVDPIIPRTMHRQSPMSDDPKFQCYLKCILESLDARTSDKSELDVAKVSKLLNLSWEVAERCVAKGKLEKNLCAKGYIVAKCVIEESGGK